MTVTCQQCGQAIAEWKIREFTGTDREKIVRFWYLCDLCLMETYAPWLPKRIPPLEDNQMWSSLGGGRTFRRAAPA